MIDIRHWLLDAAVEFAIPLRILAAPNVGEVLNRKSHGLARTDLAFTLEELIERGEIETYRNVNRQEGRARPCHEEIVRLLGEEKWSGSEAWYYELTPRGGAEWEEWAKPQWSRYNTSCRQDNLSAIGAATATVARQLLELDEYLHGDCVIIQGSIRQRVFRDWRATYWKTLREGHFIAFRTRPLQTSERSPMPQGRWARWVDLRQFYLRPADCGF